MAGGIQAADLQSIVDRTATLALLRKLVVNSGLDMRLLQRGDSAEAPPSSVSDRRYKRKEEVASVRVRRRRAFERMRQ